MTPIMPRACNLHGRSKYRPGSGSPAPGGCAGRCRSQKCSVNPRRSCVPDNQKAFFRLARSCGECGFSKGVTGAGDGHVEAFFDWVDRKLEAHGLRPKTPFINALHYARERRAGLEVFLTDPDVALDTNHLERALRVIPMGRKNWNFCWTELGAKHFGIVQSLIVTCRLHNIDVSTYLVDVLQRVAEHPASRVAELTPRLWKRHVAANPLRSALHARVA